MFALLEEALRLKAEGRKGAFVTIVRTEGSAPREPGAKMLVVCGEKAPRVIGTIGGGRLEFEAVREAADLAAALGKARYFEKDLEKDLGMACGGKAGYLIEPLGLPERLVLCGGGHVGLALFRIMKETDFAVTVVDALPEYASPERFPGAEIVGSFDPEVLEKKLPCDERTYVVIVTRDHPTDFKLARFFLPKTWAYLGVIASKTKAETLRKELREEGFDEGKIGRISSPIGLPLGGPSPAEIAVSIAAEMIKTRAGKNRP